MYDPYSYLNNNYDNHVLRQCITIRPRMSPLYSMHRILPHGCVNRLCVNHYCNYIDFLLFVFPAALEVRQGMYYYSF